VPGRSRIVEHFPDLPCQLLQGIAETDHPRQAAGVACRAYAETAGRGGLTPLTRGLSGLTQVPVNFLGDEIPSQVSSVEKKSPYMVDLSLYCLMGTFH
jgi:hypothetical protein